VSLVVAAVRGGTAVGARRESCPAREDIPRARSCYQDVIMAVESGQNVVGIADRGGDPLRWRAVRATNAHARMVSDSHRSRRNVDWMPAELGAIWGSSSILKRIWRIER
jgi:hypothetical protein